MAAVKLIAQVDEHHRLVAEVPESITHGKVEILLLVGDGDDAGQHWMTGISQQWHTELSDSREDIYTLDDGEPIDGSR